MKKPANYWRNFSNLKKELEPLIKKYKRLPSHRELKSIGLQSLSRNGIMFHGGSKVVAKKLKTITYDEGIGRVDRDHWTLKNAVSEINKFVKDNKLKLFPTNSQLKERERHDILGIIHKFKRSTLAQEKDLKVEKIKRGNKFFFKTAPKKAKWTLSKTLEEVKKVMDQVGHFPSSAKLDELGKFDLRGAVAKFGFLIIWEKLGKPKRKNTKYQYIRKKRTSNEVVLQFKDLTKKIGHPPSERELISLDKFDLLHDLKLHFNSIHKLCDFIGYDPNLFGMYKTNAGNFVRSLGEAIFCNIMTYLKISHQYEGLINKKISKYKYDFKARNINGEDIFIEIWGYDKIKDSDSGIFRKVVKNYEHKKRKKIRIYQKSGLKLIQINAKLITNTGILNAYKNVSNILLKNKLIKKVPKIKSFEVIKLLVFKLYDLKEFQEQLKIANK